MADALKVSEDLVAALESAGDDELVDVVVELAPSAAPDEGLSRAEKIAARKEAFDRDGGPVVAAIQGAGGEVLGVAWINQTMKARVPRRAVEALADLEEVTQLDATRALELDSDR